MLHRIIAKFAKGSTFNSFCTAKLCADILNDADNTLYRIRRVSLQGKAHHGASAAGCYCGCSTEGLVLLLLRFFAEELINRKAGMDPGYKRKS